MTITLADLRRINSYGVDNAHETILAMLNGTKDPLDVLTVAPFMRGRYEGWEGRELAILDAANQLLDLHGVEGQSDPNSADGYGPGAFSYVNTGDSYDATLILHDGEFHVGSWGDLVETIEAAGEGD